MTLYIVKKVLATFLVNHVYVGTRCFERKRKLLNAVGNEIGEGTKVVGPVFITGRLITGKDCWLGSGLTIHGNGTAVLGDCCDIAPDVIFLTGGHAIGPPERRAGAGHTGNIRVEDGCWIGAGATLLHDVTVGKGTVVAACACVAKDLSPNILAGGVPAVQIRELHEA